MYLLHPIIVHFAIVLLAVAVVCDFLYLLTQKKNYWQIAGILLVIGTLSAIGAVLTGSHAYEVVDIPRSARQLVRQHRNTGTSAMWLFILTSALRFGFIQFVKTANLDQLGLQAKRMIFEFYAAQQFERLFKIGLFKSYPRSC